jgi:hypothetical protein
LDYDDYVFGIALSVLRGKLEYRQHITSATMIEDPPDVEGGEEYAEEKGFYAF